MRVFLDGVELKEVGLSLGSALDAARAASNGRLIVEARADGFEISALDLESPPERVPYAARIDFTSADGSQLMRTLLTDAAGALDAVSPRHTLVADEIRGGHIDQALQTLGDVLRTWSEVRTAMELASRSGLTRGYDASQSGADLAPVLSGLSDRLTEIKRALSASDWSSLADVLAYDMEEQTARCRDWLLGARGAGE